MKFLSDAFKNDPVLRRLGKVAAFGGVFAIASALYFQSRIRSDLLNAPFVKDSLQILKDHQGAVHFLGPPIAVGKIDLGSKNLSFSTSEAQIEVPITGEKHTGLLHLWASRPSQDSEWTVCRVEVSVNDRPGKRILIHRAEKQEEPWQTATIHEE